jgi:hypothetical protein
MPEILAAIAVVHFGGRRTPRVLSDDPNHSGM